MDIFRGFGTATVSIGCSTTRSSILISFKWKRGLYSGMNYVAVSVIYFLSYSISFYGFSICGTVSYRFSFSNTSGSDSGAGTYSKIFSLFSVGSSAS